MRRRLPVTLKLATVSAALTFMILLLFATVIGALFQQRLHANFDDDLRATAADLEDQISFRQGSQGQIIFRIDRDTVRAAAAGGAVIRVVDRNGRLIGPAGAPDLGPPIEGVRDIRGYRVVSRELFVPAPAQRTPFELLPSPVEGALAFVQYGKPEGSVDRTVGRVRLFLALGVAGGTLLAFLAGLLVARRAMRPIAGLTRAAREVARTRDPDIRLPKPEANDEVSDLARTFEEMLRELGAARSETESALARQRDFVADASHELRTPLTSILANLELLEAEVEGEPREIAGSALRSSRRMRRLVADLLLLARADAGREAPRGPVDLAVVAREAASEANAVASEHTLSLDVPAPVTVQGSSDDLHRMLLNLIENAYVHTPAGTPVTVAVHDRDGSATVEVSDRGPGVPAELGERVFDRFARAAGDTSPAGGGSGLGLAIVRAVAEAHGGGVVLEPATGGGARFVVTMPASGEPAAQTSTTTGSTIGRRLSRS
jgi:two-component system OmpR family sensor kinase